LEDRLALAALSITDVSVAEVDTGGTSQATFTVNLSAPSASPVKVAFATTNGTATLADSDYVAKSGMLTFAPGVTSRQITVNVNGDGKTEQNETFFVNLSSPMNATISDAQGRGTILNDDQPRISITDVALTEGNAGTKNAVFTVSLTGPTTEQVTVAFATANGTATVGNNDYVFKSGVLTFTPGSTTRTIAVVVKGDTTAEADEDFFVNLTGATHSVILDNQGKGTIVNDDPGPPPGPAPEARVTGLGNEIPDGDNSSTPADGTDYGNVAIGSPLIHTFVIHNDGNADLLLSPATISGSPYFAISGAAPTSPVPPGGSTSIEVTFTPGVAGPHSATLSIPNNDANEDPYNFVLTGNGVGPDIRVTGLSIDIPDGDTSSTTADGTDYGNVPLATAVVHTFVIHNDGLSPLTIVGYFLTGDPDFALPGPGPTSPVPPGGSTSFDVTFTPTTTGPKSTTLEITSDDPDESPYTFLLTGNGVGPDIRVTGNTLDIADGDTSSTGADGTDYGSVPVATPVTHTFVIHNDGPAPLTLGPIVIIGSGDFVIDPPFPTSPIVPGGSISVFVTFTPSSTGPRSATLSISSDDPDESPYTFTLDGIGF